MTREGRAAAFAAAFERRHDREDGGGGASACFAETTRLAGADRVRDRTDDAHGRGSI